MLYQEKGLLLSAVFLIDFMYFERGGGSSRMRRRGFMSRRRRRGLMSNDRGLMSNDRGFMSDDSGFGFMSDSS